MTKLRVKACLYAHIISLFSSQNLNLTEKLDKNIKYLNINGDLRKCNVNTTKYQTQHIYAHICQSEITEKFRSEILLSHRKG